MISAEQPRLSSLMAALAMSYRAKLVSAIPIFMEGQLVLGTFKVYRRPLQYPWRSC